MKRLACIAVACLAACKEPPAPDATYLAAHPAETARLLARCANGAARGEVCANAREAQAMIDRETRMKMYRGSFE